MKLCIPGGLGACLLLLMAAPAVAQARNCGPRDMVLDRLATTYGETRRAIGLGSNNGVMEVFASDDSGTWTITVTMTSGLTCLVASGESYETLAEALPMQDEDT
ncbi:hypothetical protein [Pseudooceanicola nanhaiensis]|uniref:hypothetical protein n=1 Tax=Pseudooceanicola nanhaiensis TaxID=375761 RepID=UPI001CD718E0|nr:hypothetical protein [Pseudooceanicola nanhaiensis]MCA0919129.1 hypothetical protein [Pseudooceanicola nanhaiensis]